MIQLNLVVIKTSRQEEQVRFYSTIGITFESHRHGNGPYHYAATLDGLTFEIYPLPKGTTEPDTTTRLGFTVENLNNTLQRLEELGVETVQAPASTEWGYAAVVKDPDGRRIELVEQLIK
ncbi:VOC family protein [Chitinophaga pinensis]|uniref:Glyoxalase/bleomycin resistance protein/dioxygenase n=1 Tax=Chitinophaga pinensis (strain ATCC 43595 / DSM 2588 / LMG 13176 / NBRC 15968 / NCIMB 11800 / UQM 2034) TaxID=485918 RepID=A0A979GAF2_CHIPD|nr:glyoxalase/bleomycin resistance/extradiol dioxygenase family protein [Chitinophaga pinensis]ACU63691.1 Glyoxalase/bleomycin resistance protein/dioxygenase [Chitinophaga pinensis DSM 2588]